MTFPQCGSSHGPAATDDDDDDPAAKAAQKAWLLAQYEYDDADDDDGDADDHEVGEVDDNGGGGGEGLSATVEVGGVVATTKVIEEDDDAAVAAAASVVDDESDHDDDDEPASSSETAAAATTPEMRRLDELRQELAELEADASNDANNYMRSKSEIRDLQKRLRTVKQQVVGLERKVRQQQQQQEQQQRKKGEEEEKGAAASGDTVAEQYDDDEDEGYGGGLFSIFDDDTKPASETSSAPVESTDAAAEFTSTEIPDIPDNWTGKTPKEILEDWCRKEKISKPVFQKLQRNGCNLRVRLGKSKSNSVEAAVEGPIENYKNAQHYVAVEALYAINPSLPLYRLFPPFYRDLWLSWLAAKRREKEDQDTVLDSERRKKIEKLIRTAFDSTSTMTANGAGSTTATTTTTKGTREFGNRGNGVTEAIPTALSWDADEVEATTPDASPRTETATGRRLRDQFRQRQETPKYREMFAGRANLPIYAFHEEILETVERNAVTILCAETGTDQTIFLLLRSMMFCFRDWHLSHNWFPFFSFR